MKRRLNIFTLLFVVGLTYAQTSGLSTSENYIYSKNCLNEDCTRKTETVEYSDGLGRSKQIISIKSSPTGKDIVTPVEYDAFGRQGRSYMPIPQLGTQNGAIYINPKSNAAQTFGSDPYFYSESVLENSPLERMISQTKAGTDYQGHSKGFAYDMNAVKEVKNYNVATSWTNKATTNSISIVGTYSPGQLVKTSVTDEEGHTSIEFKNGQGQTILVRKILSTTKNADTYYVYNKYGQLVFVIPPLASVSPSITPIILNDFCYQYRYDSRNRQVEKKLPGKGWEYIIYDKQDRILMSQDANMGVSQQWLYTKYDQFGRPLYTGIYKSSQKYGSAGREVEQNTVNNATIVQNENRNTVGFSANGVTAYYTNSVYPTVFTKILSISYYDTYPTDSPTRPSVILGKNTIGDNMSNEVNTKNLSTASYIKNIEDDNWTKSYIWYDSKGRTIGTHSINHLGGTTKTESSLDFVGVVQQTKTYHKRLSSDAEKVITQTFEYDSQNRLKKEWHQVDNLPQELLSENTYNELSQLVNKKVGNGLQSIDYAYNLRGAVTKVNDPVNLGADLFGYSLSYYIPSSSSVGKYSGNISEVSWKTASDNVLRKYAYQYDALNRLTQGTFSVPNASAPQNNFFNESVQYDLGGNMISLQRNGQGLSGTAELIDDLTYNYTGNRLNSVTDTSKNYSGYPDISGNVISYDDNGNMKDHIDKGILQIDYNFLNLPDYVKFDQTYNPRPSNMESNYNVSVRYLYRADGTKLKKTYIYGSGKSNLETYNLTEYLDGFQYEDQVSIVSPTIPRTLKFVATSEGYYNFENNKYIYNYTDHLGNVRLSYFRNSTGSAEVLVENNFYPFGLKHEGYNQTPGNPSYNYKYNGKEYQKETGWSDYGARMYMSDIGRWGVIDPLAETSRRFNPYNYALDNPVMFIDPDGMKAISPDARPEMIGGISMGGAAEYFATGGRARWGSFDEFLNGQSPFGYMKTSSSAGGGGGNLTNIIINFIRKDKEGLGNFVNNDFEQNGWHVIDASSINEALIKLSEYLGDSKADNIYINAHGLASERYVYDGNGQLIPDSKSSTGYKMTGDTGFHVGKEQILGSDLQQYVSDKSKLSPDKLSSINSFIGIANYVKSGKNLIMGSCWTVRYDDLFGLGISSIVKSRDIFANRDFSSNYTVKGKGIIPFQNFINYNQTSDGYYLKGWVRYNDGAVSQQNFNIIMTKYGVKTIK